MSTLDEWTSVVCLELGLDPAVVDVRAVLDLARDVAHAVDRPAAPVTAYLLGVAVGEGRPVAEVAATLSELAQGWERSPAADNPEIRPDA